MAKRPAPGMPILVMIGDRQLQIRYPLRVLKQLQRDHDIDLLRGIRDANSTERISTLLFYGLKTHQPDLTLEWLDDNVDATQLVDIVQLLAYAATGVWPDLPGRESPNGAGAPIPITGSPSGLAEDLIFASASPNSGT